MTAMTHICNDFGFLRHLGLAGDTSAAKELREEYGQGLSRVVRRVLRRGRGEGELAEFILRQASELRSNNKCQTIEETAGEVLNRLCEMIVGASIGNRIETGQRQLDATVAI